MCRSSFSKRALVTLEMMPVRDATRVKEKIFQFAKDPHSLAANVTRLVVSDYYRLRVGDWRFIFNDDGAVIAVIRIGQRKDIYK